MKKYLKRLIVIIFEVAGCFLALYLGGYWMLFRPIKWLYLGFTGGTLTLKLIAINVIKIFLSTTVFGAVWCIFDILAGKFRED